MQIFMLVVVVVAVAAIVGIPLCLSRDRLARKGGKGGCWISLVSLGGAKAAD